MTPRNLNRLKLIGFGALAAVPVLASYLLYWFWYPQQHVNYGALLEPRVLPGAALRTLDGEPFSLEALRGRWIMLAVDGGKCGPRCQQKLWHMRQVRQAQGKELDRIERVWIVDDEAIPDGGLAAEYHGTRIVRDAPGAIVSQLPAERSVHDHVYLIDPLGNLMLRFPATPDARRMIKDLGRLLRYSRTG